MATWERKDASGVSSALCRFGRLGLIGVLLVSRAIHQRTLAAGSNFAATSVNNGDLTLLKMGYTTAAYRDAATEIMLAEANCICRELQLPEEVPLDRGRLTETFVQTPYMSDQSSAFGTISSRRYSYAFSRHNKFSDLIRFFGPDDSEHDRYLGSLKTKYAGLNRPVDTNAAYGLAVQWLGAVGVDVRALNRDSSVQVDVWYPGGGKQYVPRYWVRWIQPDGTRDVATVELVEPEHLLLKLIIEKPQYVKRHRLVLPNRDTLLQQTTNALFQEMWLTTEAYKKEALKLMLAEATAACRDLRIPQRLPIREEDVTEKVVETPFFSDRQGHFAMIGTGSYAFAANAGSKLSVVAKDFRFQDESKYLHDLDLKYAAPTNRSKAGEYWGDHVRNWNEKAYIDAIKIGLVRPWSELSTNALYKLGIHFLESFSADLPALESDSWGVKIEPRDLEDGRFVPLYEIVFFTGEKQKTLASVQVLEPEQSLVSLIIEEPKYIKRKKLVVANREKLLKGR